MDFRTFLDNAANVVPSKRQLDWFDTEFYGFIHFGVNTFTDKEWGDGTEDPSIFNPGKFDAEKIVEIFKRAGMRGLVITAKHHDGFCLWPSKYTEHSIKNSPYKNGQGDIVKELADACHKNNFKFGFYLSPWDRNSKYYGTYEYNTYYKNQLTELLTDYGKVFHVWFDGACGEGPNGKKQEYDFPGYIELIRKYQPDATIFNDHGPDVRWCGNESGTCRHSEWAVVPHELVFRAEKQTEGSPIDSELKYIYNTDKELGSLQNIIHSKGLAFCGSEVDMSIRPGWFYHENEEPHSLERLWNTYLNTVGANCCFHLNVPPTREGLIDERDEKRLYELGEKISNTFRNNLAETAVFEEVAEDKNKYHTSFDLRLEKETEFNCIVLEEDIAKGQRVENFAIYTQNDFGKWSLQFFEGTCIGHKKICIFETEKASHIRIVIISARGEVNLKKPMVYKIDEE